MRIRLYGKTRARSKPKNFVELGAVVLRRAADERLEQEQRGHHEEEPGGGALPRRERDVAGRAERERRLLAPGQPSLPPAAERANSTRSRRAARPATGPTRRSRLPWACCRPAAPAASCSCTSSRGPAVRRRRPRGPREIRRQLPQLRPVGDRAGRSPARSRLGEVAAVVVFDLAERRGLRGAERQRPGSCRSDWLGSPRRRAAPPQSERRRRCRRSDDVRRAADVVRGEVRSEVGAVPEDGAVLHQPVVEEHLLAVADVAPVKRTVPSGDDACRGRADAPCTR